MTGGKSKERAPRGRVLVVVDEPSLGRLLARVLGSEHEVTVLASALVALDRIATGERFDLILCDVMLPEFTAMDLVESLGPLAPELVDRVICMTGGAYTPRAEAFRAHSGIPHFDKPFEVAALRTMVREHLARAADARRQRP